LNLKAVDYETEQGTEEILAGRLPKRSETAY
jgi:hypothetical protein